MPINAVFIFFSLHMLIATTMLVVGGIYHNQISSFVQLTKEDINAVPSLAIAVAIIFFIFLIGSCIVRSMCHKEGYMMMCILFLMILLAVGIHGGLKMTDKSGAINDTIHFDMNYDFRQYNSTNSTVFIQALLDVQSELRCCGVNNSNDYNTNWLPRTCCPNELDQNITFCQNVSSRYTTGCANLVYDNVLHDISIVAYASIILTILQIFGTLFVSIQLSGAEGSCLPKLRNYEHF